MINIVATNVYPARSTTRTMTSFGLPVSLIINRDCSYAELCCKLLESQIKYFRDRNMLKYRDLASKMFTLSLVDPTGGFMTVPANNNNSSTTTNNNKLLKRINSSDELPLYAECVDQALNESVRLAAAQAQSSDEPVIEHIRLVIEWRSYEDLTK